MTVSIELTDEELAVVKQYAKSHQSSVSKVVRHAILERIEDEFDLYVFEKSMKDFKSNPKTYSLDEVSKILNIK